MVSLSIIIPTCDPARPLKRTLRSIASQPLYDGDEILVVGDCLDDPHPETGLAAVRALVADFGPRYRFLYTLPAAHDWGHTQINIGMTVATGDYLVFQDDDDVFTAGAFDAIRAAAAACLAQHGEYRPLMFRFVTRFRTLLWATPEVREEWVGGHSFVVPNVKRYLAPWGARYQGDYDHIRGTLDRWPGGDGAVVWREEVIAFARPETPG